MEFDTEWFDKKYREGGKPSLEDKAELFSELDVHLSDRTKSKVIDCIKECLYELRREYKPSIDAMAHNLIFCFGPLLKIDKNEYGKFVQMYKEAILKHSDKVVFKHNFDVNC